MRCHGLQCGFCTPGMMITARALLDRNPNPDEETIREAISGQYPPLHRIHHDRAVHPVGCTAPAAPAEGHVMTTLESSPAVTPKTPPTTTKNLAATGGCCAKKIPRFIRGRGNYVDDVVLPGMLHLAILRSPYAHARIASIDVTAAQAHPKVKAVVTGADLAEKGLAWMPTLSNDVQAVLATDKVRFQGQEVAFVVAEDRYSARDALELIDVDYEPLDPVVDVRTALDPSAAVIRTDLDGQDRQPLLRLGDRRRGRHRGRVREGRRDRQTGDRLPPGAPGTDGNLRRGSRFRPRHRKVRGCGPPARRRMRTARFTHWSPGCPNTRSR